MSLHEEKPGPFVSFSTLRCRRFGRESVSYSDTNWQESFDLIHDQTNWALDTKRVHSLGLLSRILVHERPVLFRVQDFKQGRGWVTMQAFSLLILNREPVSARKANVHSCIDCWLLTITDKYRQRTLGCWGSWTISQQAVTVFTVPTHETINTSFQYHL